MRSRDNYLSWFLPAFLNNDEWREFVEAVVDEIVDLQRGQMGTFDDYGFSGASVINNGDFSNDEGWTVLPEAYDPHGPNSFGASDFQLWTNANIDESSPVGAPCAYLPVGSDSTYAWLVRYLPGVTRGAEFTIRYTLSNVVGNPFSLFIGTVPDTYIQQVPSTEGTHEVTVNLTDYFLEFCAIYDDTASFELTGVEVVGTSPEEIENGNRTLIARKLIDYDEASRYILDMMHASFDFPSVVGLPDEMVRRFLRNNRDYNKLAGTSIGSLLLFYFFGLGVKFRDLYAFKGDYEGKDIPWIPQLSLIELRTTPPDEIHAQCAQTTEGQVTRITMVEGHSVLVGDLIENDTHQFENSTYRRVVGVEGADVIVDNPARAYEDDYFSLLRSPSYAVNPQPDTTFKIPHIDVLVKRDLLQDVDVDFEQLREFLLDRLPANVCIRNIGFDNDLPIHDFGIWQVDFIQTFGNVLSMDLDYPTGGDIDPSYEVHPTHGSEETPEGFGDTMLVMNPIEDDPIPQGQPGANTDIHGDACDRSSYISFTEGGDLIASETQRNEAP